MEGFQYIPSFLGSIEGTTVSTQVYKVRDKMEAILLSGAVGFFIGAGAGYFLQNAKNMLARGKKRTLSPEENIKEILFSNTLHEKNPITIYQEGILVFCNLTWERITGYTFEQIQEISKTEGNVDKKLFPGFSKKELRRIKDCKGNIMELFYSYSHQESQRVKDSIDTAHRTGEGYEEQIFTLQSRDEQLIPIAWHNEVLPGNISIRKGNIDLARKLQVMMDSGATIEDLSREFMRQKDEYTSGHISRVMYLSLEIAGLYGYDSKKLGQLKIKAGLHDIGKTQVDDAVLKKPGPLTKEELDSMGLHPGNGILNGIRNNYGENIRGMPHHSDFSGPKGIEDITFEICVNKLGEKIQSGEKIEEADLHQFNYLMGTNIPEEARIISIADVVDAIVSRRIYNKHLGTDIEEIILFLEAQLLSCAGLVVENNEILLDETKWKQVSESEKNRSVCIRWGGNCYIPCSQDIRIQFDPCILVAMHKNGYLNEKIKETLRGNDRELIPKKIMEIGRYLEDFEKRKMRSKGEDWSEADEANFVRLGNAKKQLESYLGNTV